MNAACALLLLFVMAEAVAEAVAEAAAEAEAVAEISRTRPGGSHWRAWSLFRFLPSKPLSIINFINN